MRKIKLLLLVVFLFFAINLTNNNAEARTQKVVGLAQSELSTELQPDTVIDVKLPIQKVKGSDHIVAKETFIKVKITKVVPAKRGKRAARLEGKLYSYTKGDEAEVLVSNDIDVKIKKFSKRDFKNMGISAATSVTGYVLGIPLFSQGIAAVKGAIKPIEDKNRWQSAGISAYKSSPLAYVERGADIKVMPGELLTVSLKQGKDKDLEDDDI